jgi:UDP-2,3-diacylglucosamine hydrolase
MNALFIADAHLSDPNCYAYTLLLKLLKRYARSMDYLVILGDLFDLWIGDNKKMIDLHRSLLEVLWQLRKGGTEILYLKGNHDFFMGEIFLKMLEIQVFEDELILEWGGHRIFTAHGDRINKKDYGYRLLRSVLRSKSVKFLILSLNDDIVYRIGQWLSSHTQSSPQKQNQEEIRALFFSYAKHQLEKNFHVVILAHSHIPHWEVVSRSEQQKCYLNPGSWSDHYTYIWYQNGHFELRITQKKGEKILFDFPRTTR